jgi:hypothetical protein
VGACISADNKQQKDVLEIVAIVFEKRSTRLSLFHSKLEGSVHGNGMQIGTSTDLFLL